MAAMVVVGSSALTLSHPVMTSPAVRPDPTADPPSAAAPTTLAPESATLAFRPALDGPAATVRATVLAIPVLGLRTELVDLGVDAAGALVPPSSPEVAGWFTAAAAPGEIGPVVIVGHVDSRAGPGVFFGLADLTPGAEVEVGRSDGRSVRYRVVDVAAAAKDAFPTQRVYGPTPGPELRLVTCGGEFDRAARRYLGNLVVSAVLVDPA